MKKRGIFIGLLVASLLFVAGVTTGFAEEQSEATTKSVEGEEEKVFPVDWLDSGLLVLNNGDRVVLAGVFVPSWRYIQTRAGKQVFSQFWTSLREKVLSRLIRLVSYETKKDRYRTRYGDLYLGNYGDWLQSWLVSMGWSWVLPSPWSPERNRVLLEAEREARLAKRGFWGTGDFRQGSGGELLQKDGFAMVQARVREVTYYNEGWRLDVGGLGVFVPVEGYIASPKVGDWVEIRGWVFWVDGLGYMDLKSHYQLLDSDGLQWVENNSGGPKRLLQ